VTAHHIGLSRVAPWKDVMQIFPDFFFIGGVVFIVDGLIGFLFGVPRSTSGGEIIPPSA
jgi:hypothetical protein